jgi:hypothetical protein
VSETELKQLLDRIRNVAPMTPEQIFEQKISYVFGMLDADNPLTKDDVRRILREQAGYTP